MNKLEKTTKILSVLNIVLCLLVVVSYSAFYFFADRFDLKDNVFDLILWTVMAFFILALIAVLFFEVTVIIHSIRSKKIIKHKSTVIAHIINVIFVSLILVFINKLDLWFVFY